MYKIFGGGGNQIWPHTFAFGLVFLNNNTWTGMNTINPERSIWILTTYKRLIQLGKEWDLAHLGMRFGVRSLSHYNNADSDKYMHVLLFWNQKKKCSSFPSVKQE